MGKHNVIKNSSTHRYGITPCWFRSSPESQLYTVGDKAFHASEEAQVLGGKRRAYKAHKEHGHQQILSTN